MLRAASVVLLAAHAVGADTYNVVVNGAMNEPLTVIGSTWAAGLDGFGSYIASSTGGCYASCYLRWEHDLGTEDFTSTMNLVVTDLYNSATTFEFDYNSAWGSHFGFAGWGGLEVFTEGPLYGGGPYSHGHGASYGIIDGELMTFVVQRRGDDYTISVTTSAMGEKVVHTQTKAGDIQGLGLRPWRGTMRLYDWTVTTGSSVTTTGSFTFQAGRCYPQSKAPVINTVGLMSDTLRRTGTPQECYDYCTGNSGFNLMGLDLRPTGGQDCQCNHPSVKSRER